MTRQLLTFVSIFLVNLTAILCQSELCVKPPFARDDRIKDDKACPFLGKSSVYIYPGDGGDSKFTNILIDISREFSNPNHFHRGVAEPLAYYLSLRNEEEMKPCKCYLPNKKIFSQMRNQCAEQPQSCDYRKFSVGSVLSAYCHEIIYDAECEGNVCPFLTRDRVAYTVFNDTYFIEAEGEHSIPPETKIKIYDRLRLGVIKYLGIQPHEIQQKREKKKFVLYSRLLDASNGRIWMDAEKFYEYLQKKAPGYDYTYLDSLGDMSMKERALFFMNTDVFIGE